ncbi:hypothetical protein HCAG_02825 [Histoplasma mississippiense (nom. inval.)]|uniref:hypothetical protein n=1 Tax=Ajellomyces capsulatus (strain NAm1 / WU24) TaxID=2059318 RepID=UPI000157BC65|nr:hypothetical protein HCAG_02825 [Histoplasma mississippiense (nom. inval.)]EDN06222.1 hypothetical protein HCAG_02825 [Histoplasma mississippiense (nom. inval.)]
MEPHLLWSLAEKQYPCPGRVEHQLEVSSEEKNQYTYSELDRKVSELAFRLHRHGVGRDSLVGVFLGCSADYLIACLAALRAGGAFLVLELAYPPNLLTDVIDDSNPAVVITNQRQAEKIKAGTPLIVLDKQQKEPLPPTNELPQLPTEDDLERLAHPALGARLPDLRTLWLNGEVVTTDLARRAIKALPNSQLLSCYSACETHEIACGDIRHMLHDEALFCPVGPPLYPKQTYILNDDGNPVEHGVSGELFVGGTLLARGYLNRPETTSKAFLQDPFDPAPGAVIHRTGDTAKMLPSGLLEISGRVGSMIKLRGYSVVPGKVENVIIKRLAVSDCVVIAHGEVDPPTLNGHTKTVRAVRDGHTAALQADLPAVLRVDSILEEDIQPFGAKARSLSEASTVLLTGATGFLGAFLLHNLLETTSAKIVCLVRFNDPCGEDSPGGVARIRRNLLDLGLWRDSIMERVEILPGNLSRKRFGLSPEAFEKLAAHVHVIIHAAATVNLVYPYAALRGANVGGTREILRLACHSGATVQYVSTNGVLPPSLKCWPEDAMLDVSKVPQRLLDSYGQTKWVAEQLVLEAGRRGLPVAIYRAGTISGHSTTGAGNAWDLLSALVVKSIHLGYAPDVEGWRAEMTPVDFVSKAIVHLSNQIHTNRLLFHLGDTDPVDTRSIFENLKDLDYPTQHLGWEDGMPTVDFLKGIVVLSNNETKPFHAGVQRPKVDINLLEIYTRYWFARGWRPHSPSRKHCLNRIAHPPPKDLLSGRVAVITGASSGIGAAVAAGLAREGAHVALGARRMKVLEAIKSSLPLRYNKAIIRQTDVTDKSQVEALVRAAHDELGPVDVLVVCAGVMYFTMMANTQMEEWDRTVDVNCKGLLHCLGATVPSMLSRGRGQIVAISSDAGRKVFPGLSVYFASKFFVEATLQGLRLETAGKGLRIMSVQPGNTATDLLGMSTDAEAIKQYGELLGAKILDPEDVSNSIIYALRQPEHVAVNEVLIEPRDEPI